MEKWLTTKALKANGLWRLGKYEESIRLCHEVQVKRPPGFDHNSSQIQEKTAREEKGGWCLNVFWVGFPPHSLLGECGERVVAPTVSSCVVVSPLLYISKHTSHMEIFTEKTQGNICFCFCFPLLPQKLVLYMLFP